MAAGQSFDLDPTVPQGSETLKSGDNRIRNLATGILRVLGFDGTSEVTATPAPFFVNPTTGLTEVYGDPVTPLGIATMQYAGRRALFAGVSSGDQATYSGTTNPVTGAEYDQNAVYILQNNDGGGPNSGMATLQLNGGPIAPLLFGNGAPLVAEAFQGNDTVYLAIWDSSNFRLCNYFGGPVPLPVVLPGNPTLALQATPKQYVDTVVRHTITEPIFQVIWTDNGVIADLITKSITTPPDDNNYMVMASYNVWTQIEPNQSSFVLIGAWLDVNGVTFAPNSVSLTDHDQYNSVGAIAGTGICVTIFPGSTPVTVKVRGQGNLSDTGKKWVARPQGFLSGAPASALQITLLRVQA